VNFESNGVGDLLSPCHTAYIDTEARICRGECQCQKMIAVQPLSLRLLSFQRAFVALALSFVDNPLTMALMNVQDVLDAVGCA
jgi:hypothetical protein